MSSIRLEADKTALIREILNIDDIDIVKKIRAFVHEQSLVVNKEDYTRQMIDKFCGAWHDDRTAEQIIEDIYSGRVWNRGDVTNLFNS